MLFFAPMALMPLVICCLRGIKELGVTEVKELLLDWLYSFLTVEEQDRLTGWHLGVSL